MKKIEVYEPYFFLFFGLFHLHRIWGLIDRKFYATFWVNVMENKGIFCFVLMGILAVLCVLGIRVNHIPSSNNTNEPRNAEFTAFLGSCCVV